MRTVDKEKEETAHFCSLDVHLLSTLLDVLNKCTPREHKCAVSSFFFIYLFFIQFSTSLMDVLNFSAFWI